MFVVNILLIFFSTNDFYSFYYFAAFLPFDIIFLSHVFLYLWNYVYIGRIVGEKDGV